MTTFKVLLTDAELQPPRDCDLAQLAEADAELICCERPEPAELISLAKDADAIMVAPTQITAETIAHLEKCRIIAKIGTGYDNIDEKAAGRAGIPVTNVPSFCTLEVADHALAHILNCAHKIAQSDRLVRAGRWEPSAGYPLTRLAGKRLGLVGYGQIGRAVAPRAEAFSMRVTVFDPYLTEERVERFSTLEELLRHSDIVSLHLPLTDETQGLIGEKELAMMKRSAILINTARGAIVDEAALIRALASGTIAAAGLDTLAVEPPAPDNPLLRMDNVLITPHCAAFTEEAIGELLTRAYEEVARALGGQPLKHLVNQEWLL